MRKSTASRWPRLRWARSTARVCSRARRWQLRFSARICSRSSHFDVAILYRLVKLTNRFFPRIERER